MLGWRCVLRVYEYRVCVKLVVLEAEGLKDIHMHICENEHRIVSRCISIAEVNIYIYILM